LSFDRLSRESDFDHIVPRDEAEEDQKSRSHNVGGIRGNSHHEDERSRQDSKRKTIEK